MAGIKESEEAIKAAGTLFKELKALAADGIQWSDAGALIDKYNNDAAFNKVLSDGLTGIELIVGELSDISFIEGFQLINDLRNALK